MLDAWASTYDGGFAAVGLKLRQVWYLKRGCILNIGDAPYLPLFPCSDPTKAKFNRTQHGSLVTVLIRVSVLMNITEQAVTVHP